MGVSTLTLAKKIKALVQRHPALVAEDGTDNVEHGLALNFEGDTNETVDAIRGFSATILNKIAASLQNEPIDRWVPELEDNTREAQKKRIALFAARAIHSIKASPRGLLRTSFQTRTFSHDEVYETINFDYNTLSRRLEESSGVFQFKRVPTEENGFNYTWILLVNGAAVGRGTAQPIHKMLSGLMKMIEHDCIGGSVIQAAMSELAKLRGDDTRYYWYLSDNDTTMHYREFAKFKSVTSCMSKPHTFFEDTGPRQHPMDCYDASPDWRLMFFSRKSPEQIIAEMDAHIAGGEHSNFEYPFLSRCMVLPSSKETSGRSFETPYVFGKFYGHDKLIAYFYDDNNSSTLRKNDNILLTGCREIAGGRVSAIKSTREGKRGHYLMPYFDKANTGRLVTEGDKEYWVSTFDGDYQKYTNNVARCSYEHGTSKFTYFYSPGQQQLTSVSTFEIDTFPTIFGPELESNRDLYRSHLVNGTYHSLPAAMFVIVEGQSVLRGDTISLFDGSSALLNETITNTERYKRIPGFGLFDMTNPNHANSANAIEAAAQEAEPTPLPEVAMAPSANPFN